MIPNFIKSAAKGIGGSVNAAFKEKSVSAALLKHIPVTLGIGAVVGGVVGSQVGDHPVENAAKGAVAGAGGALAVRSGRNMYTRWGKASLPAKAAFVTAAAIGTGVAARAFTHEDSYAAQDTATDDGMGGYEPTTGVRERMESMNATGDMVFGLHAKRH